MALAEHAAPVRSNAGPDAESDAGPKATSPGDSCVPSPQLSAFSPRFHLAVEFVGRRWTGAILRAMLAGSIRYTEISGVVPGLSDRLLSGRLREFEASGVVDRVVIPDVPVRIEYRLTEKGRQLERVFAELAAWADRWIDADGDAGAVTGT